MIKSTPDKVLIENLKVAAIIGVYAWEREIEQVLIFDVALSTDFSEAVERDELAKTIDYVAVSDLISRITKDGKFQLLETLAEKVCEAILENFEISEIGLKVSKPGAVPGADNVGVKVARMRE